jgi:hypothetical protein
VNKLRTLGRWLTDWRNGATLVATLVLVVVLLVVNDAIAGRSQAFDALERQQDQLAASRAAASRRIDLLQARIDDLVGQGQVDAQVLGQLVAEVEALRSQVRMLGGRPVIETPSDQPIVIVATTSTTRPTSTSTSSTPAPPASTTTTTAPPRPAPSPADPFPCAVVFVPVLCTPAA